MLRPIDGEALLARLPRVRGRYTADAELANTTWFRCGGPAEVLFKPADPHDLGDFLSRKPVDVPVTVIGVGSNLLIRDGGIPGVVIRLGREFATIQVKGTEVTAGAAALDANVANAALDAALTGIEFLTGVPGTIGGSLRMNAGAFGFEVKDALTQARALDDSGNMRTLSPAEMNFVYRGCGVPETWIFVDARFACRAGDRSDIDRRMREMRAAREANQPVRLATGGSTFKNPPGAKAWELIEKAGCRGLTIGGAMVSEKHCNFLLNTGRARAADIEALGEEVRLRVRQMSGIDLEWEIRRIGVPLPQSGGRRS